MRGIPSPSQLPTAVGPHPPDTCFGKLPLTHRNSQLSERLSLFSLVGQILDAGDLVIGCDAGPHRVWMAVVGSMEIAAACVDETVLFTEGGALGFVLRAVAGVLHLNAIDHPLFDQLPHQRHTLVDRRVSKNDDCPGCFGRSQYIPHRAVFRRVEHMPRGFHPKR